ncbi:MAG: LiaF transmembrane domain-containing protein [Chloroflexota bacterium]
MRSGTLFWGLFLVLLGGLLLLSNLGIITASLWGLIWPLLMVLLGVWIIFGRRLRGALPAQHVAIPLDGARSARLRLGHGAGRLTVRGGAAPELLAEGDFAGGVDLKTRRTGDLLEATLRVDEHAWSDLAFSSGGMEWSVAFNPQVPLDLRLETGAGEAHIDLTDLLIGELELSSGASSTDLALPAHAGLTRAHFSLGAASLRVRVPAGVAARVRSSSGLATIQVDTLRFPASGGVYQSPDYETAANRADIFIEAGAATVEVR